MYVVYRFTYSFNTGRPTVVSEHATLEEARKVAEEKNAQFTGIRKAPHYVAGVKR